MGLYYDVRSSDSGLTTVDTAVSITGRGSEGAVGAMKVPKGCNAIRYVKVAFGSDGAGVGAGIFVVRLKGKGITNAPQRLVVGGVGGQDATGNNSDSPPFKLKTNIECKELEDVNIEAENDVVDVGTSSIVVGLGFGQLDGKGVIYDMRVGAIADDDVATNLTSGGSEGTLSSMQVPQGVEKIAQVLSVFVNDSSATGENAAFVRLKGNGLEDGEQYLPIAGAGGTLATSAPTHLPASVDDVEINVVPGNQITIQVEFTGTDSGSTSAGVALGFV